jgi:hypothetical protein
MLAIAHAIAHALGIMGRILRGLEWLGIVEDIACGVVCGRWIGE